MGAEKLTLAVRRSEKKPHCQAQSNANLISTTTGVFPQLPRRPHVRGTRLLQGGAEEETGQGQVGERRRDEVL